ncbi:MAG: type II restriction endonuclease, partial [Asgard group archaeon]|nr:type II restriction endonuclease [Asgard group archaeon]
GFPCLNYNDFVSTGEDAILIGSDNELMGFARERLNYNRQKGLDFVARINNEYIIGEAKFLTDFGGHQNAQVVDAMNTLRAQDVDARIIAILDGVLYIESNNKMHRIITGSDYDILSALVLREFLYQI